jgi:hypothetical protein
VLILRKMDQKLLQCMLSGLETLTTELGKSKEGIVSGPQVALIRPF